jgi:hypothetical protein
MNAADDRGQQIDERAEEEVLGVLALGGVPKELVEGLGAEGPLHQAAHHDRHRALGGEPLEHLTAQHGSAFPEYLAGDQGRFV